MVEQLICNQRVGGSNPFASSSSRHFKVIIPDPTIVAQGSIHSLHVIGGEVAKRSNAADCKSAGLRPSEVRILPSPPEPPLGEIAEPGEIAEIDARADRGPQSSRRPADSTCQGGSSSVGRASAFQAEGRGSESRLPLHYRRRWASSWQGPTRDKKQGNRAHVAQW